MRIWALVSQKGGSGKTTLAVHLATYAVQEGETVALIDLDPQQSAMAWSTVRTDDEPAVASLSADDLGELPNVIEKLRGAGATLVVIDTAPHTDTGSLAAIRAADLVVLPVRPSYLDVNALQHSVRLLEAAGKLNAAIAVLNAVPAKGGLDKDAAEALQTLGVRVAKEQIGQRNPFANALPHGKGVTEFAAKDAASTELKSLYRRLVSIADDQAQTPAKRKAS